MATYLNKLNFNFAIRLKDHGLETRPGASDGLWLGLLLPIVFILSIIKYPTTDVYNVAASIACGLAASCLQSIFARSSSSKSRYTYLLDVIVPVITVIVALFCISNQGFGLNVTTAVITVVIYQSLLFYIIKECPKCFTFGELMMVAQAMTIFSYSAVYDLVLAFGNTPTSDLGISTIILEAGLLHVVGVCITLNITSAKDGASFAIIVASFISSMLILLHIVLGRSPVLWIINFILFDTKRVFLVLYWAGCAAFAVVTLSLQIHFSVKASTSTRKWFHLFAAMVYLPGFIYDPVFTYLASGIALAALVALETVRKIQLKPLSEVLDVGFNLFADEKDVGGLSLTPMYLLIGIACPLAILPASNESIIPCLSGLLSVAIGDSAASIVGKNFGYSKWHGTSRSKEGTIANILSQFLVLFALRYCSLIDGLHMGALLAVLVNSAIEAKTDQVDNLSLPFVTLAVILVIPESCMLLKS